MANISKFQMLFRVSKNYFELTSQFIPYVAIDWYVPQGSINL